MPMQNLWGSFDDVETIRTPALILQEQAGLLGKLTNEVLEGEVRRESVQTLDGFAVSLYIVAPALQEYHLHILRIFHRVSMYPVKVEDSINGYIYNASDEAEFVEALRGILSSEKVQHAIAALISEAQLSF